MSELEMVLTNTKQGWNGAVDRTDKLFAGLSDEELLRPVAEGRNRLIYILGHLAATGDRLLTMIGVGDRVRPELDEVFITSADGTKELPPVAEVRVWWREVNARLGAGIEAMDAKDWLKPHGAVSEEDFKKEPHRNRFAVLLSRTNHMAYHLGQVVLFKK